VKAVYGSRAAVGDAAEKHGGYDVASLVRRSKARKVAYIEWLGTSVPRRGYGRALLRLALERLHASGVREAFLAAAPDRRRIGNADLQRFYRQHGFQHWVSDPSIMMARLPWKPTPEPDDE
jgi:ribosomal protein S18 acetylase RimI-like enzyme